VIVYALALASIGIGIIIIRIAFAGDIDRGVIADKLALPRLDDGAASPASQPLASARPALAPKCKRYLLTGSKDYFGFLTS
jgi:hypothetical protein